MLGRLQFLVGAVLRSRGKGLLVAETARITSGGNWLLEKPLLLIHYIKASDDGTTPKDTLNGISKVWNKLLELMGAHSNVQGVLFGVVTILCRETFISRQYNGVCVAA